MIKNQSDFGTLASEIKDNSLIDNKNVVKVITEEKLNSSNFILALDFFRKKILKDYQNIYHHIGIYSYTVNTLERFISLKQTKNEIENKLEQLRALDNNIKINIALAQSSPIGVDTEEDYLAIKKIMEYKTIKMNKIYFQGTYGAYSHLASLSIDPKAEVIPCKTFDECFLNAIKDEKSK